MAFANILLYGLRILVLALAYLNLVALAVNRAIYIRSASNKGEVQLSWKDWAEIGCSLILAITSLYGVIGPTTAWNWRLKYPRALLMFGMAALLLCINAVVLHDQVEQTQQPGNQQVYGSKNPFYCDPVYVDLGTCYSYWISVFMSICLGTFLVPELFLSFVCAKEIPTFKKMQDVEMSRPRGQVGPSPAPTDPSPEYASHVQDGPHEPNLRVMYARHSLTSSSDSPK